MKRNWRRYKKLNKKSGATLVELIVTFALIGIFTAMSVQVISNALKVYYRIQSVEYGIQVSDTLMQKICGEVEGAWVRSRQLSGTEPSGGEDDSTITLKIEDNGNKIDLYDHTGSPIIITTKNNQLVITYKSVMENDTEKYEKVDWTYDDAMYMGFNINKLTFSQADPNGSMYPKNVIKVDLILEKGSSSYSATRYVACYNFNESDYEKISSGN